MKGNRLGWLIIAAVLLSGLCLAAEQGPAEIKLPAEISGLTAKQVIEKSDLLLRGDTSYTELRMIVHNEEWAQPEMTMEMKTWENRLKKSFFIRITGPTSRVRGVAFLKSEGNLWQYQPRSEKVTKVHPSLMLQSWMGSDFSNDDLVKESSVIDDYTHKFVAAQKEGDVDAVTVELVPKPEAAVVWGKILSTIRTGDFIPVKEEFFDDKGVKVREMDCSEIKEMGGRMIPTICVMHNLEEKGRYTRMEYLNIQFNVPIADGVFTQANLKSKDF